MVDVHVEVGPGLANSHKSRGRCGNPWNTLNLGARDVYLTAISLVTRMICNVTSEAENGHPRWSCDIGYFKCEQLRLVLLWQCDNDDIRYMIYDMICAIICIPCD
ncbi:unnamed protein product [Cercopithifilaria johnstoni]|uniref:Uncharacterized protein n=1 Tax=Cercopithifilaria johnstoni TaxID=2874296 RepID=A0A8J2LWT8_9BILA|nr:unnamed protein product [Cercopithifilaria johnstoni]